MRTSLFQRSSKCLLSFAALLCMVVAVTSHADDHGNTTSSATAVTLPATLNGVIDPAGDNDWFKFTLTAPTLVTVVSGGTTDVYGHLILGGSRGSITEIYGDNDSAGGGNFRLSHLLPAGTHYVVVRATVYGGTGAYTLDFQSEAPPAAQPDITLGYGGTNLQAGALVDFGNAGVGTLITKDIQVGNIGDAELRTYAVRYTILGTLPSGASSPWRTYTSPPLTILPGRQATVRIGFQPTVAGLYNGKATVVSSDGDETFYEILIRGNAQGASPQPEIAVKTGTTEVANNGTVDVGSTRTTVRATKTITIANTGAGELKISSSGIAPVGTAAAFSIYGSVVPASVPAGGRATFDVALQNNVAGSYAAKLTLTTNDSDENPTVINLTGTVTPDPVQGEIAVALNGSDVANNGSVPFGSSYAGALVTKDLVLSNPGTATLNLTSWGFSIPSPTVVSVPTTTMMGSLTATVASSSGLAVGMVVNAPFPAGTTVTSISGTLVTFSSPAISTVVNASVSYFAGGTSALVNAFRFENTPPTSIPPGGSATVKIGYLPLQTGNHAAILRIYNNDADENPFVINLTGTATVNPNPADIAVSLAGKDVPTGSTVDWGAVPVGNTALKTFAVTNTGGSDLRITGLQASPVQPVLSSGVAMYFYFGGTPGNVLPPGQSGSLIMIFKPALVDADYKATLTLTTTDPDESPYRLNLIGRGASIAQPTPDIEININGGAITNNGSFDFGPVNSGTLSQKSLLINNTGSAPLTITGLSVGLPVGSPAGALNPFGVTGTPNITVGPRSAFGTWVNFAPTVAGNYSGVVQLVSNDTDETPYSINVTGTAVGTVSAPELVVTEGDSAEIPGNSQISYGTTVSGTPVSKQFTISNTGNAALTLSGWTLSTISNATISGYATTTTAGSPTATVSSAAAASIVPGMSVGSPFPIGTSVVSVTGASVTFSAPALNTVTNQMLAYYPPGVPVQSPFLYSGVLPTSVAPGANAKFTIVYSPTAAGSHSVVARFSSNDLSENPFPLILSGTATGVAATPEIAFSESGTDLPQASTVAFGTSPISVGVTKQFVVSNTGAAPLNLSGWSFSQSTPVVYTTGSATLGSAVSVLTDTTGLVPGMVVSGPFPSGTTLVSLSGKNATLSAAATTTFQAVSLSFRPATSSYFPFSFVGALPSTVAPGATATVSVKFLPTAAGSCSMNLRVNNNDSNENPFQITVTGEGILAPSGPEINVSYASADVPMNGEADFGSTATGTSVVKQISVKNSGTANLTLGSITFGPNAVGKPVVASTRQFSSVATVADPSGLTIGMVAGAPFSANTVIAAINGNLVTMTSIASSTLTSATVYFYPVGTNSVQPFRLTTGQPASIAPGATIPISVTYAPTTGGSQKVIMNIPSNDADENPYKLVLSGTSVQTVTPPEIEVLVNNVAVPNGGSFDFGSVNSGTRLQRSLTVKNLGTSPLTVSGMVAGAAPGAPVGENTPFGLFSMAPITIAGGTAAGLWVDFGPSSAGTFTGLAKITSDDADEGTYTIQLTGTGVGGVTSPEVSVSHLGTEIPQTTEVSYGTTAAGTTVSKQFTIHNTGDATLTLNSFMTNQLIGVLTSVSTTTTLGSVVGVVKNATQLVPGMSVGFPFPSGTTVVSVTGNLVTFSAPAVATLVGQLTSFYRPGVPVAPQFRIEGTTPSSVAPGATATFTVTYAPTQAGTHTMIARFNSNDLSEASYQFFVTGSATGFAPAPEIGVSLSGADVPSGGLVNLGTTAPGSFVTKQLVISNTGVAPLNLSAWTFANTAPLVSATATVTSGVATATLNVGTYVEPGMVVSGPFPAGTTLVSISGTAATFSAPAVATIMGAALSFYPPGTSLVNPFSITSSAPASIAPGGTATMILKFAPSTVGSYGMNLRVTTNDPNENPFLIRLSGSSTGVAVAPDISVLSGTTELAKDATVAFDPASVGNVVTKDIIIKNTGTSNLTLGYGFTTLLPQPAPSASPFYVVFSPASTLAPGASGTLRIGFKPMLLTTSYSSRLSINSNDPDESPFTLTLTGTSLATQSEIGVTYDGANLASNGSINFGSDVQLGNVITKTITISNTGDGPLAITGWSTVPQTGSYPTTTVPPFYLGNIVSSIPAGGSANINLVYRPVLVGTDNWVVTMTNSDGDEGVYKINLNASAVAATAPGEVGLAVDGADIATGGSFAMTAAVNAMVSKDITITNTGTGPLVIGGVRCINNAPAGGTAFSTSTTPVNVVPVGGSTVWKVWFRPTAAGSSYSATLTLFNTDPDEGVSVLTVTGSTTP